MKLVVPKSNQQDPNVLLPSIRHMLEYLMTVDFGLAQRGGTQVKQDVVFRAICRLASVRCEGGSPGTFQIDPSGTTVHIKIFWTNFLRELVKQDQIPALSDQSDQAFSSLVEQRRRGLQRHFERINRILAEHDITITSKGNLVVLSVPFAGPTDRSDGHEPPDEPTTSIIPPCDKLTPVHAKEVAKPLLSYLRSLDSHLKRSPLLDTLNVRLDRIRIPLRVVPFEPTHDIEMIKAREHFRSSAFFIDEEQEPAYRRIWAFRGNREGWSHDEPMALARLEPTLRRAVLLGDPGSGKTEWLKHAARRVVRKAISQIKPAARNDSRFVFPVYMRFTQLVGPMSDEPALREFLHANHCTPSVWDADLLVAGIMMAITRQYGTSGDILRFIWRCLRDNDEDGEPCCSLFLDGWDEVRTNSDRLAACISAYADCYKGRVWVSSRIVGYRSDLLRFNATTGSKPPELQICPFTEEDTQRFIRTYYRPDVSRSTSMLAELRNKASVAGMAQNPLLVTLLCKAFVPSRSVSSRPLPLRRADVYERILRGLVGEWKALDKNETVDEEGLESRITLLQSIAHRFFPHEELDTRELDEFLWDPKTGYVSNLVDVHPIRRMLNSGKGDNLLKELCRDGALVPTGAEHGSYMFLHLTFQEYLTARAISRRDDWGATIVDHVYDPVWVEPLSLCGGILRERAPLFIAQLFNKNAEDIAFRPFQIGVRAVVECQSEYLPSKFDEDLFTMVVDFCAHPVDWLEPKAFHRLMLEWGSRAFPFYLTELHGNDATRVKLAIIGLTDVGLEAVPHLLPFLKSSEIETKRLAVKTLATFGGDDVFAHLLNMLDDENEVKEAVVPALSKFGPRICRQLEPALKSQDTALRRSAAGILALMKSPKTIMYLAPALTDPDQHVVTNAILGIGWSGSLEANSLLRPCLCHSNPTIRCAAVTALADIKGQEATALLIASLDDDDHDIQALAAELLGKRDSKEAIPVLIKAIDDSSVKLRAAAMVALARLGYQALRPNMYKALGSKKPEMRQAGLTSLHIMKVPDLFDHASRLVSDSEPSVQAVAINIVSLAGSAATTTLQQALKVKNSDIQRRVLLAMGNVGTAETISILGKLLSRNWDTRVLAGMAAVNISLRLKRALPPNFLPDKLEVHFNTLQQQVKAIAARLGKNANS